MAKICEECGKNDWDAPKGCKSYITFTLGVGDWLCDYRWKKKHKTKEARK